MKKLTTPGGVFGPYSTIETLDDRYRCDGADLPFTVVGEGVVSDVEPGDFPPKDTPIAAFVPTRVSMRKAELQLLEDGLLDDIEALIETLPRAAQIEWRRATEVDRNHPLVEVVRVQKGLTVEQIDELFIKAAARP